MNRIIDTQYGEVYEGLSRTIPCGQPAKDLRRAAYAPAGADEAHCSRDKVDRGRIFLLGAVFVAAALGNTHGAFAYERWVHVHNDGSSVIDSVRISDIDSPVWGPNVLSPDVIWPGDYMTVEPRRTRGYCRFDILVTFQTGDYVEVLDVNLCEITDIETNEAAGASYVANW